MADTDSVPKFLSLEFHMKFFPKLFWSRMWSKKGKGTGFVSHFYLEGIIAITIACIALSIGIPMVIGSWGTLGGGTILGWLLSVFGGGAILTILFRSISSEWSTHPTYDNYLFGICSFMIALCHYGAVILSYNYSSGSVRFLCNLAGLFLGYILGVYAGLWSQRLGPISTILNMLAGFASIILFITNFGLILLTV